MLTVLCAVGFASDLPTILRDIPFSSVHLRALFCEASRTARPVGVVELKGSSPRHMLDSFRASTPPVCSTT